MALYNLTELLQEAMPSLLANTNWTTSDHTGNYTDLLSRLEEAASASAAASSSPPAVEASPRPMPPSYLARTQLVCDVILQPLVCSLGIVGNGLSLGVLTRREMAAATTSFLAAMAASDMLLLALQLPTFFGLNAGIAGSGSYQMFIRYYTVIR